MSWAEDDFQSEKMDRSRHRKSREGIASVPEAANTPPKEKIAPPAGGLRLERERERERETLRQGRKKAIWAEGGVGWGFLGAEGVFYDNFLAQTFFCAENLGS